MRTLFQVEANALDVSFHEDEAYITCEPQSLAEVRSAVDGPKWEILGAKLTSVAKVRL